MIDNYLKKNSPDYLFVSPIKNRRQEELVHHPVQGYFRLFPFIQGSRTINVVSSPSQAFEAAFQFGKFTRLLAGFDASQLHTTIPDFHNLSLRYQQYENSLKHGNANRVHIARQLIDDLKKYTHILTSFEKIQNNSCVKKRVTHHDTKISNVLFDDGGKGIAIIDLDTVMPGYFISDVGDMMRTYLSPANEEEMDFSKIEIRDDFFRGIVHGYVTSMGDELTEAEHDLILYSGQFIIYMQAIRFLADYCNNDSYYEVKYEDNNLVRAGNQICLLKHLEEKTPVLKDIIEDELNIRSHIIIEPGHPQKNDH
jgi:Ser/Thr protein kinase RdoA (MazF antagonist)